jgi:hypothetical protein
MRSALVFFLVLLAIAASGLFGADEEVGSFWESLFPRDWPAGGFHLPGIRPQSSVPFALGDPLSGPGVGGLGFPWSSPRHGGKTLAGVPAGKKGGRAILVLSGFILFETVRYWVESTKWREDWNFRLTWEDQKIRFFTLQANLFDSNPFVTNWTHLISGHLYYSMGRYYNLNQLESLLLSVGSSLWWEYVTEWREVISLNDNLFSGAGGISLGEPLFQIGSYFSRRRGVLNKVLGGIFNPVIAFNDAIAGKKKGPRQETTDSGKPRMDLTLGPQRRYGMSGGQAAAPLFHVGMEAIYLTIPGFGDPLQGDVKRWLSNTLMSEVSLSMVVGDARVQEYGFISRAVLCGYFRQKLQPLALAPWSGYNYFLGLATSFDLFKKKASAYYDKGEYHYDFAAGERAPLPTAFTDKFAAINLIGPVFDLSLYSGSARFRFSLSGSIDFALVNALALNDYSLAHDIYEPRMKTTLVHYGYYYAAGATLAAAASLQVGKIRFSGQCKHQAYGSLEGLDRFQAKVADDAHLRDSRLSYRLSLSHAVAGTPLALGVAVEGFRRWGSLNEVSRRESEQRARVQLTFSF